MAIPISRGIAQDPTLIAGIYDMCDQWCMYCHATAWCLAYRYTAGAQPSKGDVNRDPGERLVEGVMLLRRLWKAEQGESPELGALASNDPLQWMHLPVTDPLVRLAERYAETASAYLRARPDFPYEMKRRVTGPTPLEVVAWYHMLVCSKVCRAVFSAGATAGGQSLRRDALASAKVALLGIDRSLEALAAIAADDQDPRLHRLQDHLQRLRREVERRFPEARAFVRPGLDPNESADHVQRPGP
jgi:hypothetical protein